MGDVWRRYNILYALFCNNYIWRACVKISPISSERASQIKEERFFKRCAAALAAYISTAYAAI